MHFNVKLSSRIPYKTGCKGCHRNRKRDPAAAVVRFGRKRLGQWSVVMHLLLRTSTRVCLLICIYAASQTRPENAEPSKNASSCVRVCTESALVKVLIGHWCGSPEIYYIVSTNTLISCKHGIGKAGIASGTRLSAGLYKTKLHSYNSDFQLSN